MWKTVFIVCSLGDVSVTNSYPYKMLTVCEYRCERNQSKYYYYYPPVDIVDFGSSCPPSKKVSLEKWIKKKR